MKAFVQTVWHPLMILSCSVSRLEEGSGKYVPLDFVLCRDTCVLLHEKLMDSTHVGFVS